LENDDFAGEIERRTKHNRRGRITSGAADLIIGVRLGEPLQLQILARPEGRRLCLSGPARSA
jgi:hypothetical protein